MKKIASGLAFLATVALSAQLAVAQKESHREYARMKPVECNECHNESGVAPTHDSDWTRGHRLLAQKGDGRCAECHDQSFCLDCHQGGGIDAALAVRNYRKDYVPRSHRTNFKEIHPIKALDNPQTCARCHDSKYCTQCHSRFKGQDLQFQSHRRQFRDIRLSTIGPSHAGFTPADCQLCHPGGLLPSHRWAGDHAVEARRNLQACETCHGDGDVCMTCHSARSGLRVNPHPRNWNSVKGTYRDRSNGRSCRKCHDTF